MSTHPQLLFLEEVTRRLAAAFSDVHQFCLQEIDKARPPQQMEQEVVEEREEAEEAQVNQPQGESLEQAEKGEQAEQAEKGEKTKRIRKEADDRPSDERGRRKGKVVSHKPKAPASSFLHFFKQQQGSISKEFPKYGVTELTKVAAKCWRELSLEEKEPFIKHCDEERRVYQLKMEQYRIEFPHEVEKERARKPAKKERKTSASVPTPRKERGEGGENELPQNSSIVVVGEEASGSESEEMDSLGV